MIEFGHLTHSGLRRHLNEDTYYGNARLGLWLVADGMGGYGVGDAASAIVRDVVVREITANKSLTQALKAADEEIIRTPRNKNSAIPMGTSVIAARVHANKFDLAWVGDCRGFLWRDRSLVALQPGQRKVQELIKSGKISIDATERFLQGPAMTQTLGITNSDKLHISTLSGEFSSGMQLLLCSDGLTEHVGATVIAHILSQDGCSAQETVDELIITALEAGGNDNITAIVIRQN